MKIYSFDIFDTCITRSCGSEKNLLYFLACKVLSDSSEGVKRDFVRCRIDAEFEAMKSLHKEAVGLKEIYDFFDVQFFSEIKKAELMNLEIELERQSFIPVKKTLYKLDQCRHKGKVIFISDMYLPQDMLYQELVDLGVIKNKESLYVSGEYNKSKRSGSLFDYVLKAENLNNAHWVHYGDNYVNDYIIPRRLGIKAHLIHTDYSKYENMWISQSKMTGDHALSYYASIIRSIRLSNFISNEDEFTPDIMGANFVPAAIDFLKMATADGLHRLYFASRDTYFIFLVAQKLSKHFGNIECKYLRISTKILYPLTITKGTISELIHIFDFVGSFKPISMITMLGFTEKEIRDIGKLVDINRVVGSQKEKEYIAEVILKDEHRKLTLLRNVNRKRKLFYQYLRQEKFLTVNNERVGLIDLGWRGTSQCVLKKLGFNNINFYYFGVGTDRLPMKELGDYKTLLFQEDTSSYMGYVYYSEYYMCRTTEGSTIDYQELNGNVVPIQGPCNLSIDEKKSIKESRNIILQIVENVDLYWIIIHKSELLFKICTESTNKSFSQFPIRRLLKQIAPHLIFEHFQYTNKIVDKIYPHQLIYELLYKILKQLHLDLPKPNSLSYLWRNACFIYTYGSLGEFYNRNVESKLQELKAVIKKILR